MTCVFITFIELFIEREMTESSNCFDIIAIGAGPGGAGAAIHALENGYSVCLIEKATLEPKGRYKACGGAMDWKLVEKLAYPEDKIERVVETLELHHLDGENYTKKGKGAVVWRSVFDKFLVDQLKDQGGIIKENEAVVDLKRQGENYTVFTPKGKYQGKYILAADGVTSPTLKQLKWPRIASEDIIITITEERKVTNQKITQWLGKDSLHLFFSVKQLSQLGYGWLFPKNQELTVGWGNQLSRVKHAKQEFKKLHKLPLVRTMVQEAPLTRFKAHLIPVGIRSQIYHENVYAIGDAGGFVDPISGKGIPYALQSGQIAIKTIKKCEQKDLLEKQSHYYEATLEKAFLEMLKKKQVAREKIYENDQSLKQFLALWESYRSSEIIRRDLMKNI